MPVSNLAVMDATVSDTCWGIRPERQMGYFPASHYEQTSDYYVTAQITICINVAKLPSTLHIPKGTQLALDV